MLSSPCCHHGDARQPQSEEGEHIRANTDTGQWDGQCIRETQERTNQSMRGIHIGGVVLLLPNRSIGGYIRQLRCGRLTAGTSEDHQQHTHHHQHTYSERAHWSMETTILPNLAPAAKRS